ncbi:ParB N-terminal domain-containing protein [Calothrix sp. NIES-3974]|uniref:ParB N-terminal domain-containing protein n=1 Tax=Calothrix sp. NIES-3974 TaxID=2005462 RepID=UPI000B5EA126|nr:ParB N-terminal domain-containing protein [Calothrix sp. NIES-3974]BAZ07993.1 hypothetical protein NIES3974_46610 [Calothrix sp. NIES-3974]
MKLSTSLVAIKKISCATPRSNFTDEAIEAAAHAILEIEGTINPIIVKRISLQSYEVVDGDFTYYAAARAREIDPKKGEMVNVYIVEDESEQVISKQIELFRHSSISERKLDITPEALESFLYNLEARIDKLAHQLLEESKAKYNLESENKDLRSQLEQKINPLEIFNTWDQPQLVHKLSQGGITDGKARNIAEAIVKERQKSKFISLTDVVERAKIQMGGKKMKQQKAIGEKLMLKVVDNWLSSN